MKAIRSTIAVTEVLLISPAGLFMAALFVRNLQPLQYEPAHTAQRIVDWYAARPRLGLWVLLITFPLAVLVTGGAALLRNWNEDADLRRAAQQTLAAVRAQFAPLCVAVATLAAAGVLAIVALHLMTE